MNSLIWNHNLQQAINSHYADNVEMYVAYRDVIDPIILNMENMDSAVNRVTVYSTNDTLYSHGEKFLPMDKMAIDLEELQDYPFISMAEGTGIQEDKNGNRYEGFFKQGKKHGPFVETDKNGKVIRKGTYKMGRLEN